MLAVGLQTLALYWPSPPEVAVGLDLPGLDKVAHLGMFAFATWALLRVLPARAAVLLMLAQLGLSEWVQGVLPRRSADLGDAVADLAGIGVAWVWFHHRARTPRPAPTG